MAKQSYFAEMRSTNNNPNFFKNMKIEDLRRSVKRIIKDIKYDNIVETDYSYFLNENIMEACLQESLAQWKSANTLTNALNFYVNDYLRVGYMPYKNFDMTQEMAIAASEQNKQNEKASMWSIIYYIFKAIRYDGAEIRTELAKIRTMQFNPNDL